MALERSTRVRIGLVMAAPARGAGADMAAGLLESGLLTCVYVVRQGALGDRASAVALHLRQAAQTPLRYLGALCRALTTGNWPRFRAAVRVAQQSQNDGVVHLHACDEVSLAVAETAAGMSGIGFSMELPARFPTASRRLEATLTAAQFVLAASDTGVHAASALAPRARLRRAYPSVDYRQASPRLRRPSGQVPLLLAVAQDAAGAGIDRVVEACRRLVAEGQPIRCDIICATADRGAAQAQVDRAELGDVVRVLGPVNPGQFEDRLARTALYLQVASTGTDGGTDVSFPAPLLQAMSMGLPVIAERSLLLAECIDHGRSGWLVPAGDVAALVQALEHLLTKPRLGEQLGALAREGVLERFDAELNLRSIRVWLEQAASSHRLSRRAGAALRRKETELHHA